MEQVESNTRRLLGTLPSSEMKSTAYHFQSGDVLYGRLRPYLNKVWNAVFDGLCSSEFIVLPPNDQFESRYLMYFLNGEDFVEFANHLNQGDRPRVSFDQIGEYPLPLPPLAEQRRIVGVLEGLLGKVAASRERLARVPQLLKRFRQSVLAAACSGKLTSDQECDDWQSISLGELFDVKTGGTPSRKCPDYFAGKIPWVKTAEVQNGEIWETEEYITEDAIRNSNAKVFPAGTLLVALYGEGKTRGQVARLCIDAATNQACAALVNTEMAESTRQYVLLLLLSQYYRLREMASGGNQPNLSVGLIRGWKIPLPPLAEQHEIVRRVEQLFALADRLEAQLAAARTRVDRLTQSILAKAFRGELVPTEADLARRESRPYEPASALLERIRDSASHSPSAKAPRRKKSASLGDD